MAGAQGSLIQVLVGRIKAISANVARLLLQAEGILPGGYRVPDGGALIDPRVDGAVRFVEALREARSKGGCRADDPTGVRATLAEYQFAPQTDAEDRENYLAAAEQRIAGLVLDAWRTEVTESRAIRPDVLRLTTRFLANPVHPESAEIVRYAIVLALASRYGIHRSYADLRELREAHSDLGERFASTERRRQRKRPAKYENFLLDLLTLDGWVTRHLSAKHVEGWYESFTRVFLGIDDDGSRSFSGEPWPELTGNVPDFATLYNLAFNQPTGVAGFDEVTRGIATATSERGVVPGGVVSLFAGAPGTGKTSLCLAIAQRLSELGARVRYITTEEAPVSLGARRVAVVPSLHGVLFPGEERAQSDAPHDVNEDFDKINGLRFVQFAPTSSIKTGRSLQLLTDDLTRQLGPVLQRDQAHTPQRGEMYLALPRVLVIDSLTAMRGSGAGDRVTRHELAHLLNEMRNLGVCVFLVGSETDLADEGLEYLVDNVFVLGFDRESSPRHPVRTLEIRKTRLHASHRGVHVLHLSREDGPIVSPSLHSVLQDVKLRAVRESDPGQRAVVWSPTAERGQLALRGIGEEVEPITIRGRSQVLVYGAGSSGKAGFALSLAFEPRHPVKDLADPEWASYVKDHPFHKKGRQFDARWIGRARVLVVSFLYPSEYYTSIAERLFQKRFGRAGWRGASHHVETLPFYPGYIDPETLVTRVLRSLAQARLSGRPFTAVVLDGLHNLLLQFPLLEAEKLIWPTLYRVFRVEGVAAITTFTFVGAAGSSGWVPDQGQDGSHVANARLFFQLLASKCDYTIRMERGLERTTKGVRQVVGVQMESSIDGLDRAPIRFLWNPDLLSYESALTLPELRE